MPSDLRLFGDLQCVVDLDPEVLHGRLQIGVPEEQPDGTKVLGAPIDQRRLGPSHGVRAVVRRVESKLIDPVPEDPRVLPRPQVRRIVQTTPEHIVFQTSALPA